MIKVKFGYMKLVGGSRAMIKYKLGCSSESDVRGSIPADYKNKWPERKETAILPNLAGTFQYF